jgi:hypothetical protein
MMNVITCIPIDLESCGLFKWIMCDSSINAAVLPISHKTITFLGRKTGVT